MRNKFYFAAILASLLVLSACERGESVKAPDLSTIAPATANWANQPHVRTGYGPVLGVEDEDKTWHWRGLPFASPPVGPLRWKAPVEPQPWQNTLVANEFPEACIQMQRGLRNKVVGSEDCLYLNIRRPQSEEQNLPVYVWVHGGGNVGGNASSFNGVNIANRGNAVFVALQYRVGPFGWFTHPAFRLGDSDEDDSGNYGTLDVVRALEWVKQNAQSFGGDPGNITVSGSSAGGINVLSMLLSENAVGLFDRAIMISPVPSLNTVDKGVSAVNNLLAFLAEEDDKPSPTETQWSDGEIRDYLTRQSGEDILEGLFDSMAGMTMWPTVYNDGHVIPQQGMQAFVDGSYPTKVPQIIGNSKEEFKFFLMFTARDMEDELYQSVGHYSGMKWKAATDALATAMSRHPDQPPIFVYRYDWGAPSSSGESVLGEEMGHKLGAAHGMSQFFFLGADMISSGMFALEVETDENRAGRRELMELLGDYTHSFIRTSNPNDPIATRPNWPQWMAQEEPNQTLILDAGLSELKVHAEVLDYFSTNWEEIMRSELEPEKAQQVSDALAAMPIDLPPVISRHNTE